MTFHAWTHRHVSHPNPAFNTTITQSIRQAILTPGSPLAVLGRDRSSRVGMADDRGRGAGPQQHEEEADGGGGSPGGKIGSSGWKDITEVGMMVCVCDAIGRSIWPPVSIGCECNSGPLSISTPP